jgi:glycosyltransferase involved in cell wall biosynthesis
MGKYRTMRITFVGPLPPYRGGISQHAANLVAALAAQGHTVSPWSWKAQYPRRLYRGEQLDAGVACFPGARFELHWASPVSWWRAGRAARRDELLVFPWVTPVQAPAYRVLLAAAAPTPAVAIVHNPIPHERRPLDLTLTRSVLGRLRGAVVHAQSSEAALRRLLPGLPTRLVMLPSTLELPLTELPPGPPWRLLFVGFVRPYKGADIGVEAVRLLRGRGVPVELTVAGEFWEPLERWQALVADERLQGAVRLRPGYLPETDLAELLAAHHLVIAPYRSATQSGIVPMAHQAGRPIVSTNVGGLAEQVRDGENGVLAPPGDAAAFAAAIERALGLLPALAKGARATPTTWADVAAAVVALAGAGERRAGDAAATQTRGPGTLG